MKAKLPSPSAMLCSADPEDRRIWRIHTREGPVIGRFYADGRRVLYLRTGAPPAEEPSWRHWTEADQSEIEHVWRSFAAWWTDQGYAWPPT